MFSYSPGTTLREVHAVFHKYGNGGLANFSKRSCSEGIMSSVLGAAHLERAPESTDCCPNRGATPWLDRINQEACPTPLVGAVRTNAVSERSPDLFVQENEIVSSWHTDLLGPAGGAPPHATQVRLLPALFSPATLSVLSVGPPSPATRGSQLLCQLSASMSLSRIHTPFLSPRLQYCSSRSITHHCLISIITVITIIAACY